MMKKTGPSRGRGRPLPTRGFASSINKKNKVLPNLCQNCHRKEIAIDVLQKELDDVHVDIRDELSTLYSLQLRPTTILRGVLSRKYCTINYKELGLPPSASYGIDWRIQPIDLMLCSCCRSYLQSLKTDNAENITWPSYIWKYISGAHCQDKHGKTLWCLFPILWRRWWIEEVTKSFDCFSTVTLYHPPCAVEDVTFRKMDLEASIERSHLGDLVKRVDRHLLPLVRCPWSCSEFYHKTGVIELEHIILCVFGPEDVPFRINRKKVFKRHQLLTRGILPLFLRPPDKTCHYLRNPEWPVLPSIAFVQGYPVFLTCRRHTKGSKEDYLHPPNCPSVKVPTKHGDQIGLVNIRTSAVKPIRTNAFSHTFQMEEMRGGFYGVGTIRLKDRRKMDFISPLQREKESISIQGRKDVKEMIMRWGGKEGDLPSSVVRNIINQSTLDVPDINTMKQHYDCATFMTLEDSITLYQDDRLSQEFLRITKSGGLTDLYTPAWPKRLIYVHPFDCYGAEPPVIPLPDLIIGRDLRLVWVMAATVTQSALVWQIISHAVDKVQDWKGWMLSYLTTKIHSQPFSGFGRSKKNKYNPFWIPKGKKSEHLADTLLLGELLESLSLDPLKTKDLPPDLGYENKNSDRDDTDEEEKSVVSSSSDSAGSNLEPVSQPKCSQNDPEYAPFESDQVRKLLSVCDEIYCLRDKGTRIDDAKIPRSSKVCVLLKHITTHKYASTRFPQCFSDWKKERWQMKMVVATTEIKDKHGIHLGFTGVCYTRHGGSHFPGWWKQDTKVIFPIRMKDGFVPLKDSKIERDWEIIIYEKWVAADLEGLRNIFLQSLGGQSNQRCKIHSYPLVNVPFKKNKRICSSIYSKECDRKVSYCCPVIGCGYGLCDFHYESKPGQCQNDNPLLSTKKKLSKHTLLENDIQGNDVDMTNTWIDPLDAEEALLDDQISIDSDTSSLEDDNTALKNDQNLVTEAHDCGVIPSDDESDTGYTVPVTNCGVVHGSFDIKIKTVDELSSVPGHVILNGCGSLLARKRHKVNGTGAQINFIHRHVATSKGCSVNLVYPEAQLLPTIFWKGCEADGSVVGSIPAALLTDDASNRRKGFASISSHLRSRLTNPCCLTSMDENYLCYAFDSMVNLSCRNQDTRVVLHRGIGQDTDLGVRNCHSEINIPIFDTDSVDSRPVVNKLASALATESEAFFFTTTVNQKLHFGIRRIRQWLDETGLLPSEEKAFIQPNGIPWARRCDINNEIKEGAVRGCSIALLRNWMETADIYMKYLTYSEEEPLGKVKDIWWRHEYQESQGNLSHIHALIWLEKKVADRSVRIAKMLDKIRGSLSDLIRISEIDDLIDEELVQNGIMGIAECREQARRILDHTCSSRCQMRIAPGNGPECFRCRHTNNGLENPTPYKHAFREINIEHSSSAQKLMIKLGLLAKDDITGNYIPCCDALKSIKHYPPADKADGLLSACNGRLFAATRSSQNLKFNTGRHMSRYLATYLALVDEVNRVYVGAAPKDPGCITLEIEKLHNTKISTSRINEDRRHNKRRDKKHPNGRLISLMEMMSYVLGYDQVYTTIKFVHVPTVTLGERSAMDSPCSLKRLFKEGVISDNQPIAKIEDVSSQDVVPMFRVRNCEYKHVMEAWRKLSAKESIVHRDQIFSPYSLDAVTIFSLRPPELRFVRRPCLYFKWFFRSNNPVANTTTKVVTALLRCTHPRNLEQTSWIDGTGKRIFVRPSVLEDVVSLIRGLDEKDFYARDQLHLSFTRSTSAKKQLLSLFGSLLIDTRSYCATRDSDEFRARFFGFNVPCSRAEMINMHPVPVIWYNSVKPTQANRWLIHLLLSMGEFDNELDLFGHTNLKECFIEARIIKRNPPGGMMQEVEDLTRRYILEQLVYLPGGIKQFDIRQLCAYEALKCALLYNSISSDELPAVMFTHLREEATKKAKKYREEIRKNLIQVTLSDLARKGLQRLPSQADLISGLPWYQRKNWTYKFSQIGAQPVDSVREHQQIYNNGCAHLLDYVETDRTVTTKDLNIVGGPGVGKTTLMQVMVVTTLVRTLTTVITAIGSERAKELGGTHLADLFAIPVVRGVNPVRLAELAIARLLKCPKRHHFLMILDVLFIDELGQVSAEMICTLDLILRRLRKSNQFMAGVLVISTIDNQQLKPVQGRPPLLSPHMLTSFVFYNLAHCVRASQDADLRQIQSIARKQVGVTTAHDINVFVEKIVRCCTHVPDKPEAISKIPLTVLRVFGKHAAVRETEASMLSQMAQKYRGLLKHKTAVDMESALAGHWRPAGEKTSAGLTFKLKEPKILHFFPNAHFNITFNKDGCFSQGQMAILLREDLPTYKHLDTFKPINLMAAPEGHKLIPREQDCHKAILLSQGWRRVQVGACPDRVCSLSYGIQGRRTQYGLCHRIAATLHSIQGQTLEAIMSKILPEHVDPRYALWEKAQVLVLLSRTHFAKDIYFIGEAKKTATALASLLTKQTQYSEYISYLLDRLCGLSDEQSHFETKIIDQSNHPFELQYIEIPQDSSGYVYILISTKDARTTYIGETTNLVRRLRQHNSGRGSKGTADEHLRRWALLAYVCGFGEYSSKSKIRREFERSWKVSRDKRERKRPCHPNNLIGCAKTLIDCWIKQGKTKPGKLQVVKCSNLS